LLGDVLGEEGVAELAPDEPVDRGHVPAMELFEGVDVAIAIRPDEVDVSRSGALRSCRLVPYFCHECVRQATTVARVSILSGSFRACRRSCPSSVSVTTEVTPALASFSQPGPLPPARRSTGTRAFWARLATSP